MSVKTKRSVVSKRPSAEQVQDAARWNSFLVASGTPYENLTENWLNFFSQQAEISTAQTELVKLIDAAIKADNAREGQTL